MPTGKAKVSTEKDEIDLHESCKNQSAYIVSAIIAAIISSNKFEHVHLINFIEKVLPTFYNTNELLEIFKEELLSAITVVFETHQNDPRIRKILAELRDKFTELESEHSQILNNLSTALSLTVFKKTVEG